MWNQEIMHLVKDNKIGLFQELKRNNLLRKALIGNKLEKP